MKVSIKNHKYYPHTISVSPGTKVIWTNQDSVPHTVTSEKGVWDSGFIQPGKSYSRLFSSANEYPYYCTIHPHMRGRVNVNSDDLSNTDESFDYCSEFIKAGLDCDVPEINAIRTDMIIIATHVEYAIAYPYHESILKKNTFSQLKSLVLSNLDIAKEWFNDILMYLSIYNDPKLKPLMDYVQKVQNYIDVLKKKVMVTKQFEALQKVSLRSIYGYQGVLGALKRRLEKAFLTMEY